MKEVQDIIRYLLSACAEKDMAILQRDQEIAELKKQLASLEAQ